MSAMTSHTLCLDTCFIFLSQSSSYPTCVCCAWSVCKAVRTHKSFIFLSQSASYLACVCYTLSSAKHILCLHEHTKASFFCHNLPHISTVFATLYLPIKHRLLLCEHTKASFFCHNLPYIQLHFATLCLSVRLYKYK
jgi:hypothetical protein